MLHPVVLAVALGIAAFGVAAVTKKPPPQEGDIYLMTKVDVEAVFKAGVDSIKAQLTPNGCLRGKL